MSVTAAGRNLAYAPPPPVTAGSGGDPYLEDWTNEIVAGFRSGDLRDRWRAYERVAVRPDFPGPYTVSEVALSVLGRETAPGGRLANEPEAHLAYADALVAADRPRDANAAIWASLRIASGYSLSGHPIGPPLPRNQASAVNSRASELLERTGDRKQSYMRHVMAQMYNTTDRQRRTATGPWMNMPPWLGGDTKGPKMSALRGQLPKPDPIIARDLSPQHSPVPPKMEGKPSKVMSIVDLFNRMGDFAAAYKKLEAYNTYRREYNEFYLNQDRFPAPPTPDDVRALERGLHQALRSSDPGERAKGQAIAKRVDLEAFLEMARAYWGQP